MSADAIPGTVKHSEQADPGKLPRFPRQFVRFDESSKIPCPSDRSPTKMHFFTMIDGMGGKRACRFCGTKEMDVQPAVSVFPSTIENAKVDIHPALEDSEWESRVAKAIQFRGDQSPLATPAREQFEENISRGKAASVARDLTGRHCWTVKRKIGRKKICVLHVDQGEGAKSLVFEASDWWMVLRALHVFLKNSGRLAIDENDEGGELVPA